MTIYTTIPDKLPEIILERMEQEDYFYVILFALSVFGMHNKSELINNPEEDVSNRLDEVLFDKSIAELEEKGYVEKSNWEDYFYFKATESGEDALFDYLKSISFLDEVVSTFNELFGISTVPTESHSESISGYTLSYKNFIFGFLHVYWRLGTSFNIKSYPENGPNLKVSLGKCLEENAVKFKENIALKYDDKEFTYKELNEWINRFANFFLSMGVKKGEVINVFLENRPELLFMIGAMSKIGTIGSLINTRQRSATLIHSMKLNPVRFYVIGEELIEAFEEVRSDLDISPQDKLYFLKDKNEKTIPQGFEDFNKIIQEQNIENPTTTQDILGKDTYVYIFTSGTTGMPKAAHIRNTHTIGSTNGWGKAANHMEPEDVMYITLPMFHSNALHLGWASAISGGSAVALARKFSVRNFWKDAIKYKATCFNFIGEICRYLLNAPPSPLDRKHSVRKICGNGLRPEIWNEFKERFGIREVYEHYGMTEMQGMFCNYFNRDCTVGVCMDPHAIVKYDIDKDEPFRGKNGFLELVDEGEAGLMLMKIRDPFTFAGYTNEEANRKKIIHGAFEEGDAWMNCGDMMRNIGYRHAQFVDRLGDTFRWKGENVSTAEVEDVISSLESIELTSVYGVEIPGTEGRAGMASILTTPGAEKFDFDNLQKVLRENLPPYAIPLFLKFISEVTTTSTFKIQKSTMKKEGFDITQTKDPIFVLLPGESKYSRLTTEIYSKIKDSLYRF